MKLRLRSRVTGWVSLFAYSMALAVGCMYFMKPRATARWSGGDSPSSEFPGAVVEAHKRFRHEAEVLQFVRRTPELVDLVPGQLVLVDLCRWNYLA